KTGVLVYQAGQNQKLTWLDRRGNHLGTLGEPGIYFGALFSPDGSQVAVTRIVDQLSTIGLVEATSGRSTPFTFGVPSRYPGWGVDGTSIAFSSWRDGGYKLFQKAVVGGKEERLLNTEQSDVYPSDWSPGGKYLVYIVENARTKRDIYLLPLDGDRKPEPFLATKYDEYDASFSWDGRWIAYTSDESGVPQVYVRPFRPTSTQSDDAIKTWSVSAAGGGTGPLWRSDMKELTYAARDGTILSVDIPP